MRFNSLKTCFKTVLITAVLLLGAGAAVAQQQVNLTAQPTTTVLPDGTTVHMWGYACGAVVTGSTATCAALNSSPSVVAGSWAPVVITVPTGQTLQINLTNSLSFAAGTGTNTVPTSLTIVGQLGGGLGTQRTTTLSPDHTYAQGCVTWPIASIGPGEQCNAANPNANPPAATPPTQGPRVQSFSTEVAPGATTSLTWTTPRPGTFLLESGTHPSIQGPMGLYGMVVVTDAALATPVAPATTTQGCAYTPVVAGVLGTTCVTPYNADVDLLFSEIDPVQNEAVNTAVTTAGFSETMVWSGQPGGCTDPASPTYHQCYPPAVNYRPTYYLINGLAFDPTHAGYSAFATNPASGITAGTGQVLLRLVNAGLRMHVPSVVGSQIGTAVAPATVPPSGFSLIAEDGNPLPGVPRVQSEVFMAAGKTYDVMINAPASTTALPVFDRELSLSAHATARDAGMLAYINVNNATLPSAPALSVTIQAKDDSYPSLVAGQKFTVSDAGKGVIANDVGVHGVQLFAQSGDLANGTVVLNPDGTFTYTPNTGSTATTDTFHYCANGSVGIVPPATTASCSSGITATVSLGGLVAGAVTCTSPVTYSSATVATYFSAKTPGLLANCTDSLGYKLSVVPTSIVATGITVVADANGGFTAISSGANGSFTYTVQDASGQTATGNVANVTFPTPSNLAIKVLDGADKTTEITDYRWIIEEDRTFYVDPNCTTNSSTPIAGCTPPVGTTVPPTFGVNFHTSYMPVIAAGCTGPLSCEGGQTVVDATGNHVVAVCDVGNGVCRPDPTGNGFTTLSIGQVHLDPTRRYYVSILPGDAANPFIGANGSAPSNCAAGAGVYHPTDNTGLNTSCGHGMGGVSIPALASATATYPTTPYILLTQPTPFPPAQLSVFVFEDDFPLNGEHDAGGGTGAVNTTNEPGLGGFEITLFDDAGGTGDATGQLTHDMFNQPLSNGLAGTIDPTTGQDACPITVNNPQAGMDTSNGNAPTGPGSVGIIGITGRIVTCPEFERDGITPSPLAGQAVVPNMMQGRYGVVATPAADRIARGEEWLQTNTLDGQKAHDSFLRIGEPSYFQEYGPAGWHVSIGFANPSIINGRLAGICAGNDPTIPQTPCGNTVTGLVTTERMSRTPDERLYSSGDNSSFAFTQCYVSVGDPDGEDFGFTKCNSDGTFTLSGLPDGVWRVTVFDQWNDMLVDGLSTPVGLAGGATVNLGDVGTNQWQANIYTSTFFDTDGNGVRNGTEAGLSLVSTNIRFRDGSYSNFNNTDLSGNAGFNEVFPLFSWYVVENDSTRYKTTGVHVVYDAGGPADDSSSCGTANGYPACGPTPHTLTSMMANTSEPTAVRLPANLRVPGAYYCASADCASAPGGTARTATTSGPGGSTGRVDPPMPWGATEAWQGFSGQNNFLEFGKAPFVVGETGGIHGEVNYASTRPFDDPQLLLHVSWTPDVPNVTVNLYEEDLAADKVTSTLRLIDTTTTTSWDDWAQGFHTDPTNAAASVPNMNCPGQTTTDLFYFSLLNQPNYLDIYNNQHNGTALHTIPNGSQFKCYDGMHNWNQMQPAPYDGMYQFPSVTSINPSTGRSAGSSCHMRTTAEPWGCIPNPDATDPYRVGTAMLPAGKYVVEVVVPPGYELVKEEDKNILIGDNYIAPVTQEFGGLGSIFIIPDQAAIAASYNVNNAQNQTTDLGTLSLPRGEGDTGSVEQFWPCVGEARVVPDFMSIFPQAQEVAAFAGATRNLCDRKEITLADQSSALAKFYIFTSAHVAAHFTGVITDDYTSEFDPFSPVFGEKFSPPDQPVSIKDWAGNEISRVYSDHWGAYDGLTYSSWEVNPPNPTGYGPTMMVTCMNDPGPVLDTNPSSLTYNQMITDPLFNPQYSQFCYEIPFMPGQTQYMDTPVVPTSAFAGAGYNNVDCSYPDATPAVKEVDSNRGLGPWVQTAGDTLTITALGDQMVPNNAYAGPSATTAPYNQKFVKRHFGFGNTAGTVTIGGVSATVNSWSESQIQVTVPSRVPPCPVQQQAQYGGSTAQCGQLVITNGTATVTQVSSVTVTSANGGRYPTGTTPSVTFGAPVSGTTATGTANMVTSLYSVAVSNATTNSYPGTGAITVTFSAPTGGTAATRVTATGTVITNGGAGTTASPRRVIGVNITNPGRFYTTAPTVTFNVPATGGTRALGTATLGQSVLSVAITGGGSGYTTAPSVTFGAAPTGGATATGTAATASTTFSGKRSIDTVTVTIGGKAPTHVHATDSIQAAIDAAAPGDLIIVDPAFSPASTAPAGTSCAGVFAPSTTCVATIGTHNEIVLMWKPVRLQGVGAPSSVINANTHPAGLTKLDAWRQRVVCLFGLGLNGSPVNTNPGASDVNQTKNAFDPTGQVSCPGTGWNYFTAFDESGAAGSATNPQVDRLPLEAVVGWSAELNGNLAEQLQEPSLMGALEGAAISVLAKGVNFPSDPYDPTLLMGFPTGTTLLIGTDLTGGGNFPLGDSNPACTSGTGGKNPFSSNYSCNPSSIDGLTLTDSSQGGGGIYVHGWAHNLQIANNRIYNNAGTLSGGINLGQGEFAGAYQQGSATNAPPGSCEDSPVANALLPYCEDVNVSIHNNYVSLNSSTGDELFSATPAGAGGVSICTGSDYYRFNYNWVCGNLSTGDGGGVAHLGFSFNGDIEHNTIIFNQSTNPTIPTNGGGLIIMGTPDQDLVCSTLATPPDQDCPATQAVGGPASVTPSDGVGPGLVINANLIMGNAAESGTGAGIAFNAVNGTDMVNFPTAPGQWNLVTVTNNIIVDNVGGWDGAGISLADSPNVNIINNTIAYNASTASAGILFNTLGAPLASQGGTSCIQGAALTCPQPGGLVAIQHGAVLAANLNLLSTNVICPPGHFQGTGTAAATNGSCRRVSYPKLENNIFWHNSSYKIGVGALSPQYQQNIISLLNMSGSAVTSQPAADAITTVSGSATITGGTGACVSTTQYWDIGVRGDTGPANHASGVTLTASDSVLTPAGSAVSGGGNSTAEPRFIQQYCDGSRMSPETPGLAAAGWQVPPGISDATVPNPIFNLTPSATVDEGNNWVNIAWGPLATSNPTVAGGPYGNFGGALPLGNYGIASASSARSRVAGANANDAPNFDFYNNPRKPGPIDAGAVQFTGAATDRDFTVSPAIVDFGFVPVHSPTTLDQDVQVINTGSVALAFNSTSIGISCTNVTTGCNIPSFTIASNTCFAGTGTTTLAPGQSCLVNVVFNPISTSQAQRNATLSVNPVGNGAAELVSLTGHDSIATLTISPLTPALTAGGASNTVVKAGTITITNTANPNTNVDAGPWIPNAITLTQLTGTGAFTLGGTCAVGTAVNPGGTLAPPAAGSSCTITITYTPPATGSPNASAHLTVTGLGTAATTNINANYNAN
jgi:hypothetical protein